MNRTILFAFAAAVLIPLQGASAGLPPRAAADFVWEHGYAIELSGAPEDRAPLMVKVVNLANGQVVRNPHLDLMRPVFVRFNKAVRGTDYRGVPLPRQTGGRFLCVGKHHAPGTLLVFRAEIPGAGAFWTSVRVRA